MLKCNCVSSIKSKMCLYNLICAKARNYIGYASSACFHQCFRHFVNPSSSPLCFCWMTGKLGSTSRKSLLLSIMLEFLNFLRDSIIPLPLMQHVIIDATTVSIMNMIQYVSRKILQYLFQKGLILYIVSDKYANDHWHICFIILLILLGIFPNPKNRSGRTTISN